MIGCRWMLELNASIIWGAFREFGQSQLREGWRKEGVTRPKTSEHLLNNGRGNLETSEGYSKVLWRHCQHLGVALLKLFVVAHWFVASSRKICRVKSETAARYSSEMLILSESFVGLEKFWIPFQLRWLSCGTYNAKGRGHSSSVNCENYIATNSGHSSCLYCQPYIAYNSGHSSSLYCQPYISTNSGHSSSLYCQPYIATNSGHSSSLHCQPYFATNSGHSSSLYCQPYFATKSGHSSSL